MGNGHFFVTSRRRRATMGDFQANFLRPDTGINTVEGNVAGSRAAGLSKKRAAEQADFEARKQKIKADSERGKLGIDAKFDTNANVSAEEQTFRAKTVGLVTAEVLYLLKHFCQSFIFFFIYHF